MNDRYLFKAKRTDNGEWVEGNLVWSYDADDDYKAIIIPTTNSNMFTEGGARGDLGFENWCRVDTSTICQCTGLKDKNGKLIWENDIVKSFNGIGDECSISKIVFTEEYSLSLGWCTEGIKSLLKYDKRVFSVGFKERDAKKSEVIGNIFDNPELLEVE